MANVLPDLTYAEAREKARAMLGPKAELKTMRPVSHALGPWYHVGLRVNSQFLSLGVGCNWTDAFTDMMNRAVDVA